MATTKINKTKLSVPDRHRLKIAKQTPKMNKWDMVTDILLCGGYDGVRSETFLMHLPKEELEGIWNNVMDWNREHGVR